MIDLRCCDNMELMKELPDNHIDLVYIDPPFGIGADNKFENNNYNTNEWDAPNDIDDIFNLDRLKPDKRIVRLLRYLYPRLKEMHRILKDTGSIYVHCDWRVNALIRLAMDEVFGHDKFINQIEWAYKTGGIPEKIGFSKKHDHILLYSRGNIPVFNRLTQKSYVPTLPEPHTASGKGLGVMRDEICDLCNNGSPGQKYRMVIARDVWDDIASIFRNDTQGTGYATQKPEALLERIIKASSNEGDLVADFFCGSGTTAAVAKKLNRNFIGCDISERAVEIAKERIE